MLLHKFYLARKLIQVSSPGFPHPWETLVQRDIWRTFNRFANIDRFDRLQDFGNFERLILDQRFFSVFPINPINFNKPFTCEEIATVFTIMTRNAIAEINIFPNHPHQHHQNLISPATHVRAGLTNHLPTQPKILKQNLPHPTEHP
jgi:hypothetical protein